MPNGEYPAWVAPFAPYPQATGYGIKHKDRVDAAVELATKTGIPLRDAMSVLESIEMQEVSNVKALGTLPTNRPSQFGLEKVEHEVLLTFTDFTPANLAEVTDLYGFPEDTEYYIETEYVGLDGEEAEDGKEYRVVVYVTAKYEDTVK